MITYKDYHIFFNQLYKLHICGLNSSTKAEWDEVVCHFLNKNNALLKDHAPFFEMLKLVDEQCQLMLADFAKQDTSTNLRGKLGAFFKDYYGKVFQMMKDFYKDTPLNKDGWEDCYLSCRQLSLVRINYPNMEDKAKVNSFFTRFAHCQMDIMEQTDREMIEEAETQYETEMVG